jgi:hypothetical protein
MSVHAITESGRSVVFTKEVVKIYVEDELVLTGVNQEVDYMKSKSSQMKSSY